MLIEDQEGSSLGDDEVGSPAYKRVESMLCTPEDDAALLNDENAISYNELFYNQSPYESQLNTNSPMQVTKGGQGSTAGSRAANIHMKSVQVIQRREIYASPKEIGSSQEAGISQLNIEETSSNKVDVEVGLLDAELEEKEED